MTGDSALSLVLVGREGSGKSASGNTILGQKAFESRAGSSRVTQACERAESALEAVGRGVVVVVDTPSPLDSARECLALCGPGPRVFLVSVRVGRFTPAEQAEVERLARVFGWGFYEQAVVLFTHGDGLQDGETVEEEIWANVQLGRLVERCGGRYHVFDNKKPGDRQQVAQLLDAVRSMVGRRKAQRWRPGRKHWAAMACLAVALALAWLNMRAFRIPWKKMWN